jgi:hypothetical protein
MPTIDRLSTIDNVTGSDQVPLYDASNGQARKASMAQVLAYFQNTFASPEFDVIISSPIAGFNQQLAASTKSIWLILTPAGTLASGTVTLPPVASCFDGQEVLVTSTQQITALTIAGNGASLSGEPSSLGAEGFFRLRYNTLQETWYAVGANVASTFTNLTVTGDLVVGDDVTVAGDLDVGGGDVAADTLTVTTSGTVAGAAIVTISATQTLTNKTLTGAVTDAIKTGGAVTSTVALLNTLYPPATSTGFRTVVVDASSTLAANIGTTVLGGGSNVVPVYCDGVSWKYG